MRVDSLPASFISMISDQIKPEENLNHKSADFWTYLNNALQDVNQYQLDAALNAQRLSIGDEDYLHNVTIGYERARLALQLAVEVRNRILEAYQEIMRIQL